MNRGGVKTKKPLNHTI